MATRRRRRREPEGSILVKIVASLAIVVCLGGIAAVGWAYYAAKKNGTLDADLCPASGPVAVTAFLFDITDPISEITKSDLMNTFDEIVASTPKGGLVEVYVLTEDEGQPRLTFHKCNPGDGGDDSVLTSNPKKLRARWEESFDRPLKEVGQSVGADEKAARSPIMAGIQKIVISGLSSPAMRTVPRKIVVASDMIEHTDAFSNYRDGVDYSRFEASRANDRFRTDLSGIGMKIVSFHREKSKFKDDELAEFWAQWVVKNHGEFVGYERLAGVN